MDENQESSENNEIENTTSENNEINDAGDNDEEYHNFAMMCPLCNDIVEMIEFHEHLLLFHTTTYLTMFATHFPGLSEDQIWEIITNANTSVISANMEDIFESNSYESLLQLCDDIGYHYIGVSENDIDIVAPYTEWKDDVETNRNQTKCPICLDDFITGNNYRKLKECGHMYCDECLSIWFKEHKTCPICKKDVMASVPQSDQMASISISESSSGFLLPPLEGLNIAPDPPDVSEPDSDSDDAPSDDELCRSSINTT